MRQLHTWDRGLTAIWSTTNLRKAAVEGGRGMLMLQRQCLGWGEVGPVPFGNVKNVHVCTVAKDDLLILYTKGSWESNCKQNGLWRQMGDNEYTERDW